MADHVLNEFERRILRVLLDSDRRWLRPSEIASALEHELAPVQSALSVLRRVQYVTPSYHVRFAVTYAVTGVGEDAMCPSIACQRPASECGPACACPPCGCSRCRARTATAAARRLRSVEAAR